MAEKDITERHLAGYNDVFADIVNGCFALVTGDRSFRPVAPDELREAPTRTLYTSDGQVREQERDVAKYWTTGGAVICLLGLENQTDIDPNMPLRVLGYEGADYRRQLAQAGMEPYPVVTFVLYFGTKRRWPEHLRSLLGRLKVREALRTLLNDWRIHVIELAWLTDEELALFTGDFRFVLEVLRCIRLGEDIVLTDQVIEHVDAVLKLLAALTGERRLANLPNIKRGEPMTVRNIFADTWEHIRKEGFTQGRQEGREEGRAEGREEGRAEGFLHALFSLVNDGTLSLAAAAARANMSEEEFRERMRARETKRG